VGDFTISNYSCAYNWGRTESSWTFWSLTFHIAPMTTPEPFLGVHNLNTENCSFYVGYLFPETPDSEIASLIVSNQAGTSANLILWSQSANQLYENTYLISELNDVGNNNLDGSLTVGFAPFTCGDTIEVTLSYKWRGAPAANKTVSDVVVAKPTVTPTAGGYPSQRLINLNNAECQFRILANIPSPASAGTARLTINSTAPGTDQIAFLISDSLASGLIDFTFSPEELAAGEVTREGLVNSINQISTQWSCGMTLFVSVEYRDLLNNFRSSIGAPELQTDGFEITPTKPTAPPAPDTYSITASQITDSETCKVQATVSLPDAARPISIGISEVNSDDMFTGVIVSDAVSVNGTITAVLSFENESENSANVAITQSWLDAPRPCAGNYKAVLYSPAGILASTVFSVGSEQVLVKAVPLSNANCEFKVLAAFPSRADRHSMALVFSTGGASVNTVRAFIHDSRWGQVLEATFNPTDLVESIRNNPENFINWQYEIFSSPGIQCNDLLEITLEYYQSGVRKTQTTSVIPTTPVVIENPSYSITAYPSKTQMCAITVVANAPDASRPLTLAITSTTSDEPLALLYFTGGIPQDGTINATLSMDSLEGFYSSIPYDDVELAPGASCSGEFRAVILLDESIVASDTTTLVAPPVVCGAGWTLKLDRSGCDEAPRGFFTTELNSSTPIACPAGMTTATISSKSVNDCYKPIAQTIASFKAPKALKFSGTTNLAITTNSKSLATYKVTGPCTAKVANITTKVKGKKVITKMLKVTAGKKAGNCSVTLTAQAKDKYLAMSKPVKIKVSKTGK